MQKRIVFFILALLFSGCQETSMFFNPPVSEEEDHSQVSHLLDGINDFSEDEVVGVDRKGDISEPSLDLDTLWAVLTDSFLCVGFNAYVEQGYGMAYGIYIFVDSIAGSGAASDPWGRNVVYEENIFPPYVLYFWHAEDVDSMTSAQFITFSQDYNYNDIGRDVYVYNPDGDFLEIFIPLEWLGNPDSVFIEVFTTGGSGHAQDTSPEDQGVQFTDPDWDNSITTLSAAVCVR